MVTMAEAISSHGERPRSRSRTDGARPCGRPAPAGGAANKVASKVDLRVDLGAIEGLSQWRVIDC